MAWMVGHTVAANLLMAVFLVGGLIMGFGTKQEVFPEFSLDTVVVTVSYPGASPEEVEKGIILAVEEAVQGLEGVKEVTSTAAEGLGTVTIEAMEGENLTRLTQNVKTEVDRITSFPEEAEEPSVTEAERKRSVIDVALYGDIDERVLREKAEEIRDLLLQNPDITQVDLAGVRDLEISVEVPQANLRRYGLTLEDVAAAVRRASVELPGGSLKTPGGEVLMRMKERRDFAAQYAQIPIIAGPDGSQVLLEDIAVIKDTLEDSDITASFEGKPAAMIEVYRVGDQKPIELADAVKATVAQLAPTLPEGLSIGIQRDRSEYFQQRAELLVRNGLQGLVLVFVLLAVFLEVRLAFWVSLGIPISFLGAFCLLPLGDFSINMITMFAFIVTLGIVVDDAIVVGENVYHQHQRGLPFARAAVEGAREVAMPVTFSVLTNIVAFLPMLFVPGVMGKIYGTIPVVISAVFTVSLIESLFILPAHISHQRNRTPRGPLGWLVRRQNEFSHSFSRFIENRYGPFLGRCLRHRYVTVALGAALLLVTLGLLASGRMGMVLFPKIEADYAYVSAVLPYGTSMDEVHAVEKHIVDAAQGLVRQHGGPHLSRGIFSLVKENTVEVRIYLTPPDERPVSTSALTNMWRTAVGAMPGIESLTFMSDRGGPGSGKALTVELSHRDIDVLDQASIDLAGQLADYPNVSDIDDGSAQGKRQFDFTMRPEGRSLGLRSREVANQVRASFYGVEALRLQRGRNEVKVMVRLPEAERKSEYNLEELILRSPSGQEIPLRAAVDMHPGRAYTTIDRRNARRVVSVTADVTPAKDTEQVVAALKRDVLPGLLQRYPGLTYSFEGKQADLRESMDTLMRGLLMVLLAIYAMLAVPFRSYTQPLIIMVCIPFGVVGAVAGHLLMGYSLSLMSMFGLVALSGVVVNDSLVLIDFTNRKRRAGLPLLVAVQEAGIHRFRAILLTTLTTFGGLAPMIMETSRQARFLIPMAISLGFGILFATGITLLLVPCLYVVLEDIGGLLRKLFGGGTHHASHAPIMGPPDVEPANTATSNAPAHAAPHGPAPEDR
ncbi:MAG: efflux RND transporter permease subunit [Desulfovibrionaceae bacterium]|nr:efflux RND transporter permease subunit [Desulfovibrionaceae bacterium]